MEFKKTITILLTFCIVASLAAITVIALGMVTEREYFAAVFIFMTAVVSFLPISNLLESDSNISISGPVRFLLVIILLARSVAVESNYSSSTIIYAHISSGSHNTTQDDNISYWDWEWHTPPHISDKESSIGI
jgi:hypothetical protein